MAQTLKQYQAKVKAGDAYPGVNNIIPTPGLSIRDVAAEFADDNNTGTVNEKLFKTYLEYEHVAASHIRGYNHFIKNILPMRLATIRMDLPTSTDSAKRDYLTFDLIPPGAELPMIEVDGKTRPMLPEDAVKHERTYSMMIKAKLLYHYFEKPEPVAAGEIELGKLPIMVKSDYCWLSKPEYNPKLPEGLNRLLEAGECPQNPGGYFVVRGMERVVLWQENLSTNSVFTFISKKKAVGKGQQKTFLTTRMTVNTNSGSTLIRLEESQMAGQRGKALRTIDIMLKFMEKNKSGQPNMLNVFQVFRLVGMIIDREAKTKEEKAQSYATVDMAMENIYLFTRSDWRNKIGNVLYPSRFVALADPNDLMTIREKRGRDVSFESIEEGLRDDLFPQVPVERKGAWTPRIGWIRRYQMLAHIVAEMAAVMGGLRPIDDRDSWSNKKLESPARSVERLFFNCIDTMFTAAKNNLKRENSTPEQVRNVFTQQNILTESFVTSMISSNWGVKNSALKENLTDTLARNNILSAASVLRRINTPTSTKTRQASIRMVTGSQFPYVCSTETPEGSNCSSGKELVHIYDVQNDHQPGPGLLPMSDLKNGMIVKTINPETLEEEPSAIEKHFTIQSQARDVDKKVLKVKTMNGRTLVATEDHRFLTDKGFVAARDLTLRSIKSVFIVIP